jgi:hypothetical protein
MRRVPASHLYFNIARPSESPMGVTWLTFKPRPEDITGISLSRMQSQYATEGLTIEAFAARACENKPPEKRYYVAVLSAKRLLSPPLSLILVPQPVTGDPGHIEIPFLNASCETSLRNQYTQTLAKEQCMRVIGPYNCKGLCVKDAIDWYM